MDVIRFIYLFFIISPYSCNAEAAYRSLLFNGNCATCHHLQKAVSAPSINEIRKRYLQAFPNKNEFVTYMKEWVINPKKETSLMQDKIARYGLMPQLAYQKEVIKEIAEYIYEGKIEATTR